MSVRKLKILTLEERVAVLKIDSRNSCHAVASELGVGKTQIQGIVRDRGDIMKRWEAGEQLDRKYAKIRKVGYKHLDEVIWELFTRARARNISVSGKLIQEWALLYATELGHNNFTPYKGWLEKWQKRHNVRMAVLSGEAADVEPSVVSDWGVRLKSVCDGNALRDIFNGDKTGLFYRALPTRSLAVKGGKKSKE